MENDTLIKQVCGRNRQDIKKLYLYDSESALNKKKENKKKEKELEKDWDIPVSFLNRELNTQERNELIEEIKYPKKWTSFKKWIENSRKYKLEKKHTKRGDLYIISG